MPGLFDRIGKAAQQTAAEGKIRLDIHNLQTQLDDHAKALGFLMFRQHRGETIPEEEYVKILDEMSQVESERQAKEVELEELRRPAPAAAPASAPAPAPAPAPAAAAAQAGVTCDCGTVNAPGARFCINCGKALTA